MSSDSGFRYYVIFVDDFSRFTWLYPLRQKSDFYDVMLQFTAFVENQFSTSIKTFHSDGGTKFTNNKLQLFFREKVIRHILSCPYTPAQNGRVERKHRPVTETGLAMLFHSHTPLKFWVDAFNSAVYVINRLPSKVLNDKSPFELLFSTAPNFDNFHPFGCCIYPCLRDYTANKFEPRSLDCVFLGYSSSHKGFRCYDPISYRVYISHHAKFDESSFPFSNSLNRSNTSLLPILDFNEPARLVSLQPQNTVPHVETSPPGLCTMCDDAPSVTVDAPASLLDAPTSTSLESSPEVSAPPVPQLPPVSTHLCKLGQSQAFLSLNM